MYFVQWFIGLFAAACTASVAATGIRMFIAKDCQTLELECFIEKGFLDIFGMGTTVTTGTRTSSVYKRFSPVLIRGKDGEFVNGGSNIAPLALDVEANVINVKLEIFNDSPDQSSFESGRGCRFPRPCWFRIVCLWLCLWLCLCIGKHVFTVRVRVSVRVIILIYFSEVFDGVGPLP